VTIVVDTCILLASADEDDADHQRCAELLRRHPGDAGKPGLEDER
jgi:predicted nucleic acid-binding protein